MRWWMHRSSRGRRSSWPWQNGSESSRSGLQPRRRDKQKYFAVSEVLLRQFRYFCVSPGTSASAPVLLRQAHLTRDVGRLDDRVELLRVRALLARAVARLLSAAERHVIVEARRRQIDHHEPACGVSLEVARVLQRGRDDAGRQAERRVVGDGERLVVSADFDDRGDRSEDLLAVD